MSEQTPVLLLEADFASRDLDVCLRFYHLDGERRRALRMQALYNLAQRVRRGLVPDWPAAERRILQSVLPLVGRRDVLQANLQVLHVPRPVFERWTKAWSAWPNRLIERQTQASLAAGGIAYLALSLRREGEHSWLSALLCTGDQQFPYSEIRCRRVPGSDGVDLGGRVCQAELPMPWDTLDRLFGQGPRQVASAAVPAHVPALLQYRLDRLIGPSVSHRQGAAGCVVRVTMNKGELALQVSKGRAPVLPEPAVPVCVLEPRGAGFEVIHYACPERAELGRFLDSLPWEHQGGGHYRAPGGAENLTALTQALPLLPPEVTVSLPPELASLRKTGGPLTLELSVTPGQGWYDIGLACSIDGHRIREHELAEALDGTRDSLHGLDGTWLRLVPERRAALTQMLADAGLQPGRQRLPAGAVQTALQRLDWDVARPAPSARDLVKALREQPPPGAPKLPASLQRVLRSYQRQGVFFLHERAYYRAGCLLADDMGLGKTLQVLAFLAARQANDRPSLVLCPASVLGVWQHEAARFAPMLTVTALTGEATDRHRCLDEASRRGGLLLATYAVARNDLHWLRSVEFDCLVLDEAQQIKNPDALATRAVKALSARQRIALTGTPLENRLLDLWSIMDFLNPGLLGDRSEAEQAFNGKGGRRRLQRLLMPLLLRRAKELVAPELPPRTEETLAVPMSPEQRRLYECERLAARQALHEHGPMQLLASLTRLRQICCHPALPAAAKAAGSPAQAAPASGKLQCLLEQLEEVVAAGHSALIFSQFTSMLALIREAVKQLECPVFMLTGATPSAQRARLVAEFSDRDGPALFLLSLRAAGTGLTLTKADYVFIFDPWWNPAVERQAVDRTHRIGQSNPVMAYRLIAENSVESRVLALQEEKRRLFEQVVEGAALPEGLALAELAALLD